MITASGSICFVVRLEHNNLGFYKIDIKSSEQDLRLKGLNAINYSGPWNAKLSFKLTIFTPDALRADRVENSVEFLFFLSPSSSSSYFSSS